MQESTVYRSIWREAEKKKTRAIDIIAPSTGLSIEEVQNFSSKQNLQILFN